MVARGYFVPNIVPMRRRPSNEFFYIDRKNGKKSDAALHEPILAEGDDEAAFQTIVPTLRAAG